MSSKHKTKDKVRDKVEHVFDKAHRVADKVTSVVPGLGVVDGVVHGIGRGVRNWIMDEHPEERNHCKPDNVSPTPSYPGTAPYYPPMNQQPFYPPMSQPPYYTPTNQQNTTSGDGNVLNNSHTGDVKFGNNSVGGK